MCSLVVLVSRQLVDLLFKMFSEAIVGLRLMGLFGRGGEEVRFFTSSKSRMISMAFLYRLDCNFGFETLFLNILISKYPNRNFVGTVPIWYE